MQNNQKISQEMERIMNVEKIMSLQKKEHRYNGWLVSNSLMKRSFAVLGHYFIGSLVISLIFYGILFLVMLAFNIPMSSIL